MSSGHKFIMISAMYENGGNTTQRLLDGHPELFAYPYESQPGSKYVNDYISSLYPLKYRWPVFPLHQTVADDYETIIDEECKVRIKTPQSSKFRDTPINMSDKDRKQLFINHMEGKPRTRGNLMHAFFHASADAWRDYRRSGQEHVLVGYSPVVGVDADKIVSDSENNYVLNVIRNPWSAYGDTKKRAVPLSIAHYMNGWCLHQQYALAFAEKFPGRVINLRFEDIVVDPVKVLSEFLAKVGVGSSPTLAKPSWNGKVMEQVYPWGTIRTPTPEANRATAAELSKEETQEIRIRTKPFLPLLGYENFLS